MRATAAAVNYRQLADDYRILGLDPGAPPAEARSAFRRLVKLWHPDTSDQPADAAARETRRLYQAFQRVRSLTAGDLESVRLQRPASAAGSAAGFHPGPARRGRDVVGDLVMTRRQARSGSRWRLRVATCRRCAGWGAAPADELRRCAACAGLGRQRLEDGSWDLDARCPACGGYGCLATKRCAACAGGAEAGYYFARCRLPGFGPGEVAYRHVAGQGHPGLSGAPAGDLYLRIMTLEAWRELRAAVQGAPGAGRTGQQSRGGPS